MKQLLNFILERKSYDNLDILFIRVGKTTPLLQKLIDLSPIIKEERKVNWDLIEVSRLHDLRNSGKLNKADAVVLALELTDENIGEIRRDFWEDFIWKYNPKPTAIVIPSTTKLGSLSKSQAIEALSLQRVTDRVWEIFEMADGVDVEIHEWLLMAASKVVSDIQEELKDEEDQNSE
ncbi:MAG: hypothetical protein D6732_20625 [Methanobacteriota archaeon]|nr:MAG: hypothetical protein D6732_20625 [Euryarchaeota archaeon]